MVLQKRKAILSRKFEELDINKIKKYREKNNLSLNKFADKLNITTKTLCRTEKGEQENNTYTMLALINYCVENNIDVYEFFR